MQLSQSREKSEQTNLHTQRGLSERGHHNVMYALCCTHCMMLHVSYHRNAEIRSHNDHCFLLPLLKVKVKVKVSSHYSHEMKEIMENHGEESDPYHKSCHKTFATKAAQFTEHFDVMQFGREFRRQFASWRGERLVCFDVVIEHFPQVFGFSVLNDGFRHKTVQTTVTPAQQVTQIRPF